MNRDSRKGWRIANLLLIIILITAQTGAIAHAYEHDLGTPQDRTCSTCLTASQLLGASIDSGNNQIILPPTSGLVAERSISCESIITLIPRQRGPPILL